MSGDGCNCNCDTGRLPYTLTVKASGFEKCSFFPTDVTILSVSSCFGSGGLVRVVTDSNYEGSPEERTILSAEVLEPGSGYAIKGRVQPTIELTAPTLRGADCTFTPTFTELTLECSECLKWWTPSGATISYNGSPEIPESTPETGSAPLSVRVVTGCAMGQKFNLVQYNKVTATLADSSGHPRLTVNYHRAEPTLTASLVGDGGAVLVPVLEAKAGGWGVASVSVTAGGGGYIDGQPVQFETPHLEESPASASARTVIAQPQMAVSVHSFASGEGAALSATLSQITVDGRPRFVVTGVTIQSGGGGYAVGDEVRITTSNGRSSGATERHFVPPPRVSSVSDSGAIAAIAFVANNNCVFWLDTGVVESVSVTSGGSYCLPVPYEVVADTVELPIDTFEGEDDDLVSLMYAEDDEAEPCVASPWAQYFNVFDEGHLPCTVSTASDATFGQLESVTIADSTYSDLPGSTGPAYRGCIDGEHVLVAEQTSPLVTFHVNANYGSGAVVLYGYGGAECSATNHLYQQRVAPSVTASNGVVVSLEETTDEDGLPVWTIANLTVAGGCAADGTAVSFAIGSPTDAVIITEPEATIQSDENNSITGVTLGDGGLFYRKFPWDGQAGGIPRVTVANGGGGYAVVGREEPQAVTFNPPGPWTPTLEEGDDLGRPFWSIESIAVGEGGGFTDGQWLRVEQSYPEVSETYTKPAWGVVSTFSGTIRTQRVEPTVTASVTGPSGSGAMLAVTLEPTESSPPNETWRVASVEVTQAGSDYFTLGTGISFDGGVQVTAASATPIFGLNGTIVGVELTNAGEYYATNGVPDRVEITNAGKLWRENTTLPAHVADVTVTVNQSPPSDGKNAELKAVVDSDTESETFGALLGVTVVNQGSGYTPFIRKPGVCKWRGQCPSGVEGAFGLPVSSEDFNRIAPDFSVRLFARATPDGRLIVGHVAPYVVPAGDDYLEVCEAIDATLDTTGLMTLQHAAAPPTDCSSFSEMATSDPNAEGTFTVSSGGVLSPDACLPCFSETCAGRPATLAATATVSITVPDYPNAQPQEGLFDLPLCCEGEHSAADIPLVFFCNDADPWLAGTTTLDKPGGCSTDTSITCEIRLVQDEACDLFLEVTFTGNCKERYEVGEDVFERAVVLTKVVGPLATTANEDGLLVPDDIANLDISFDEENDYPATISITFTT